MKSMSFQTAWKKELKGIEYKPDEFVSNMGNNKNADNIKLNEKLRIVSFWDNGDIIGNFNLNEIDCIRQYIEEEHNFCYYHYQVLLSNGNAAEFTTHCFERK